MADRLADRTSYRTCATATLVAAAVGLLCSLALPYWRLTVKAPQYPSGLRVIIYPQRLDGDIREIDTLNHYIGMRSLHSAAKVERRFAVPALAVAIAGLVLAAFLPWPWALWAALPALIFPLIFAADLWWWLRDSGLNLNPRAPLNRSIKPFVPPLFGPGKIAQFQSLATFGIGFYLALLANFLAVIGVWVKRRSRGSRAARAAAVVIATALCGWAPGVEAATLRVGDGQPHATVEAAMRAASDGDVILVTGGVYPGPMRIEKTVQLIGEGQPVLDGGGVGTVLELAAPHITLRGFIIRNSGRLLASDDSGVLVSAPQALIEDNMFTDVLCGVQLRRSPGTIIRRNHFRGKALPVPERGDLVRLWYSDDVRVEENRVEGGRDAVLWFSQRLTIRGNRISGGRYGLHFMYCNDSLVAENHLFGNSVGVYLMYSRGIRLLRNRMVGNRGPSGYGIGLKDMEETLVEENVLAENRAGMFLDGASGRIARNVLAANDTGILLVPSSQGNHFSANTFWENGEQVVIEGMAAQTANAWAGNFWSDYRGYDAGGDGTGDVPYRAWRLFERVVERHPTLRLFIDSPAANAIDVASRVFPVFAPQPKLEDPAPLMRPVPLHVDGGPATVPWPWLAFSGVALLLPLGLLRARLNGPVDVLEQPAAVLPLQERGRLEPSAISSTPAIRARALTKRFGRFTAVDQVTFDVNAGDTVALWGPNGAGKTTIVRCLLGLFPFEGTVEVCGINVAKRPKAARAVMGYVPQEIHLPAEQTVWEIVWFYAQVRRVGRERATALLREWGLQEVWAEPVGHLSGGTKQKLALVIALLADPPVLLLDEPTSNLDVSARREFASLLEHLKRQGKTLLFCSHRMSEVRRVADRVIVLERGSTNGR